jgi:hypothetical protein
VSVPRGVRTIRTTGFAQTGVGGAHYTEIADRGQPETPWQRRLRDGRLFRLDEAAITVDMCGARADGLAGADGRPTTIGRDNREAFHAARDAVLAIHGKGVVHIPASAPRYYDLKLPVVAKDDIVFQGAGRATRVRNVTKPDGGHTLDGNCFIVGSFARQDMAGDEGDFPFFPARDIGPGRVITLRSPADARNFTVGKVILVARADVREASPPLSEYQLFNQVTAIDGARLTLKYAFDDQLTDPIVSPLTPTRIWADRDIERGMVSRSGVIGVTCYSEYGHWLSRNGTFECRFDDIWLERSRQTLTGSAYAHCTIGSVQGNCWDRACEITVGAHDTTIELIDAFMRDCPDADNGASFGEQCSNITVKLLRVRGDETAGGPGFQALSFASCRKNVVVERVEVDLPGMNSLQGQAIGVSSTYGSNNVGIRGGFVRVRQTGQFLQVSTPKRSGENDFFLGPVQFGGRAQTRMFRYGPGTRGGLDGTEFEDGPDDFDVDETAPVRLRALKGRGRRPLEKSAARDAGRAPSRPPE